jgi:hypothetical protein
LIAGKLSPSPHHGRRSLSSEPGNVEDVAAQVLWAAVSGEDSRSRGSPDELLGDATHGTCENVSVSPTVLRSGPYRFFFFAGDRNEPVHVHVAREDKTAKFWLSPVRPAYNIGFVPRELSRIEGLVREHKAQLMKAWDEYFKPRD